MIKLKANPFYLDDKGVKWVEDTLATMTLEEKVGQLFCPIGVTGAEGFLQHLLSDIKVGAMMFRPGSKDEIRGINKRIQEITKIPLMLAANIECGGNGVIAEGTNFGKPMAVAATGNIENAYRMAKTACAEAGSIGVNWAFAPIVDIDYEFRSPITNVRTFGSDQETIINCAEQYLKAADEEECAASIKHFPGDGFDERDQHLLTSINNQSVEEWRESFGEIYGTLIDKGAKTVMIGHIAQPELVKKVKPTASTKEQLLPASLSEPILKNILRDELGFNGLTITDATLMLGFTSVMPRSKSVPMSVAAGCDMFLFNKSLDEDFAYMLQGIKDGILTEERLNEAVTRILATKASLKLHEKQEQGKLIPDESAMDIIGSDEYVSWQKQNADESITLVKDTQNLLPLSPEKTKRVYLNVIGHSDSPDDPNVAIIKELFEKEGFEVTVRNRSVSLSVMDLAGQTELTPEKKALMGEFFSGVEDFKKKQDLYVYVANMETKSNNTIIRLEWNVLFGVGDDAPWFTEEVPTLFVSLQNPYHLFDAPMMKTYINAYDNNSFSRQALMDKLMGRSEFRGKSPVDPYCGNKYIKMMSESLY